VSVKKRAGWILTKEGDDEDNGHDLETGLWGRAMEGVGHGGGGERHGQRVSVGQEHPIYDTHLGTAAVVT
jgi:hypothetical protein